MEIELPYPHKSLWPNGRAHWGTKATQTKKHRKWAHDATIETKQRDYKRIPFDQPIEVFITVHPKPRGVAPDDDNCISAAKAYLDGIADAIAMNDNMFRIQPVTIAERRPNGAFVVTL